MTIQIPDANRAFKVFTASGLQQDEDAPPEKIEELLK